jgi:5'/3'-nucleotidase SurE
LTIFITNDDGILAPGIEILAKVTQSLGYRVIIVAPETNQSGKSQSISLCQPLTVKNYNHGQFTEAYAVVGTPTDCVRLICAGVFGMYPELIMSGVNDGANVGSDLYLSGTVGAAREAALHNVPSIAWSSENMGSQYVASLVGQYFPALKAIASSNPGTFYNVNFPMSGGEHSAFTEPSAPCFRDRVVRVASDQISLLRELDGVIPEGSDIACLMAHMTSVSPIEMTIQRRKAATVAR